MSARRVWSVSLRAACDVVSLELFRLDIGEGGYLGDCRPWLVPHLWDVVCVKLAECEDNPDLGPVCNLVGLHEVRERTSIGRVVSEVW